MPKLIDLSGQRFGRLTVIQRVGTTKHGHPTWLCKCDCGKEHVVVGNDLKSGDTTSCGCYGHEVRVKQLTIHGGKGTRLYRTWQSMKRRCCNPNAAFYKDYGGRGIKVCKEWLHDFEAFHNWAINNGYTDELTIDRIDENGDYCPGNCRWATQKQQANNKRNTVRLTWNGETKTLGEWSELVGIPKATIKNRIKLGWSIERALTTPTK